MPYSKWARPRKGDRQGWSLSVDGAGTEASEIAPYLILQNPQLHRAYQCIMGQSFETSHMAEYWDIVPETLLWRLTWDISFWDSIRAQNIFWGVHLRHTSWIISGTISLFWGPKFHISFFGISAVYTQNSTCYISPEADFQGDSKISW